MWNNWSSCWFISNPPDRLIFFHRMFPPAWHRFSPDVSEGGPFKEYYKEHFPQRQPDIGFCWCKWRRIPPFKEYFPQRQPDIGLWRRKRRRVSVDRNWFSPAAVVGRCPTPSAHRRPPSGRAPDFPGCLVPFDVRAACVIIEQRNPWMNSSESLLQGSTL